MGVLNVTPDSFSDGGQFFSHDAEHTFFSTGEDRTGLPIGAVIAKSAAIP